MNCVIIDDEPLARKGIRLLINELPYLQCIGEFGSPVLAHEFISAHQDVELIFLDIEMPGLSGLEYLRTIPPAAKVILTTAYPQYALEAFELDVVDYLVKPIKLDRFIKAVKRVSDINKLQAEEALFKPSEPFIYIKANRQFIKLNLNDITYIKGLKDYVIIHAGKQKFMTAVNVGTILRQLPEQLFARVSKSFIINVDYVKAVGTDSIHVDGEDIPLGNTYKEHFLRTYVNGKLINRS